MSGSSNLVVLPLQLFQALSGLRMRFWLLVTLFFSLLPQVRGEDKEKTLEFEQKVQPLLKKYCNRCHNAKKTAGKIDIAQFTAVDLLLKNRKDWLKILEKLEDEEMPPEEPLPTFDERRYLIEWVDHQINNIDWSKVKNAGHVATARLSREEYNNTMRDLLGVDLNPARELGDDAQGASGFNNDRDSLFLEPALLEKYIKAARQSIDQLITIADNPFRKHLETEEMFMTERNSPPNEFGYVLNRGQMTLWDSVSFPSSGYYRFSVKAWSTAGPTGARLRINDEVQGDIQVPSQDPEMYELITFVEKGTHQVAWNIQQNGFITSIPNRETEVPSKEPEQEVAPGVKHKHADQPVPPMNQWNEVVTKRAMANHPRLAKIDGENQVVTRLREAMNTQFYSVQRPIEWLRLHGPQGNRSEIQRFKGYVADRTVMLDAAKDALAGALDIAVDELNYQIKEQNEAALSDNQIVQAAVASIKAPAAKPQTLKPGSIAMDFIDIEGPISLSDEYQARVFIAQPSDQKTAVQAAREVLSLFASRAFRRPVVKEELDAYLVLFEREYTGVATFKNALRLPLTAILASPHFLFKVEGNGDQQGEFKLSDFELATRLSYFLWMTMPDNELFAVAAKGELSQPPVLRQQVRRMLKDPRSSNFTKSFIEQWLEISAIGKTIGPDPKKYPEFDTQLQQAALQEPALYFDYLIREDQSLLKLIDSQETFLNKTLAALYEVDGIEHDQMKLVRLQSGQRGGLLGMSSVLTATSLPLRTSPVIRGKWVLETLLGDELPPPPPDAGTLPDNAGDVKGKTLREQFEQHRNDAACRSCHQRIDPIGFGLENFDAIGRFRQMQGGKPIDNSGELPDGTKFAGANELKQILLGEQDKFARNLSERMLSFALGRQLQYFDEGPIQHLTSTLQENQFAPQIWIEEIVLTYPFGNQNNQAIAEQDAVSP
jgi:hypothetical protein